MGNKKKIVMILLVVVIAAIIVIFTWNGYTYYKYKKIYNVISEGAFIGKAEKIDVPVKENIEGYTETNLGWIAYSTPYGKYYKSVDFKDYTAYFYETDDSTKKPSILPIDIIKTGDTFYDEYFVEMINEDFNKNISTSKDYYDILYNTDFRKVGLFDSSKQKLLYSYLIEQRADFVSPNINRIYYFENAENKGYIIINNNNMATIRLFDENNASVCRINIYINGSGEKVPLALVKNIVSTIKIK